MQGELPDSMKHNQADLYLETYQVLDLEMSRLREIQRWQASAASKLAADMQRFSRPERLINGPTVTHFWSMLKLLDILVQLDHLKNAKASIPNDFSWYKREIRKAGDFGLGRRGTVGRGSPAAGGGVAGGFRRPGRPVVGEWGSVQGEKEGAVRWGRRCRRVRGWGGWLEVEMMGNREVTGGGGKTKRNRRVRGGEEKKNR
ncbi:hypothetical protein IEQ34_019873 [Dendrobium chrysotoxum]|uniref:Uncharacterized protein n=1 Tax=Dendrobium chrysotoxum TaxID=161865 RepID=A0AAV7G9S1_DENCH|nr:hypothetical protein IEQ34_019873 [Dendrobium chrysotoxum]